jgi:primosomal replication protein N
VWQEEIIKISPDGVEMCKTIVQFRLKNPEKGERREEQIEIFSKYVDTELSKHFSDTREQT